MSDFATRLKELRKNRNLRQVDLAREMGVAQTTIANYEQHSRFPDEETLGNIANYFDVSLDYLLGRSDINVKDGSRSTLLSTHVSRENLPPLASRYVDLLLNRQRNEAYEIILDAARRGTPVRSIYTEIFEPSLKVVGQLWEINEIDVAKEHYFSEATESLMAQLYPYLNRPDEVRGRMVSVAVNGESHHIGLKMITDILEEAGWQCFYIGVNTPTASLVQAINENDADILAISATMSFNVENVSNMIRHIRFAVNNKNLKIISGGQAFNMDPDLCKRAGADGYASNLVDAIDLVNSLKDSKQKAV